MSDTAPEAFVEAAQDLGLRVSLLPRKDDKEPQGVNVWADPDDRMPSTTVWWPRPGYAIDQIIWGDNFQHFAHRDIPAETLAQRVKETL